jgi:hypothetical protein
MTPKGSRPVLRGLVGSNAHPATQLIDFLAVLAGLRHQWRGHPGDLLRATPAVCRPVHGLVWP